MSTSRVLALAVLLSWCAACGEGNAERAPFADLRAGSVFHLSADDYCTVKDRDGRKRMQAPCAELRDFLHAGSPACQRGRERAFLPWTASFPDASRELRLCRSYARPARAAKERIRFVVFGDAGRGNDTAAGYAQSRVAESMRRICEGGACDFALVVGDLIYPTGVTDVFDPAFDDRFEDEYREFGDFDFYLVPGNHDYRGNVEAEVEYTYFSDRWRMPDRHFAVPDLPDWLSIYGVDSTPLVGETDADTRPAQEAGLQSKLCGRDGWRIILGHHPPVSHGQHGDSLEMAQVLTEWSESCPFHVYLAGHDHHQEHLSTELFDVVLQGAGGAALRRVKENAPPRRWGRSDRLVEQRFARSEHGFAVVDATPTAMAVSYYSIEAWKFEAAEPLGLIDEGDYVYRCAWKLGESGGCK